MNAQYRAKQQFAYAIGKKVVEEVREKKWLKGEF